MRSLQPNPAGLPHGAGSMQIRGAVWWLIYRDKDGRTHQESSGTSDRAEARRLLAEKALDRARYVVLILERIAHGKEETASRKQPRKSHRAQPAHPGARFGASGRSVRPNSARGAQPKANQ